MAKDYIYGMHVITSLLQREPHRIKQIWLDQQRDDERARLVLQLCQKAGITCQRADKHKLKQLSGDQVEQGVVAQASAMQSWDETRLFKHLDELSRPAFLLLLDGVQDPHNLGACLRTADAAGVDAVIVPKDRACGLTATVRKVACGAAEWLPLVSVTNLARCMEKLKQQNIWLTGLDASAEQSLYQTDLGGAIGLVLGAEGKGLRRLTREQCDHIARLPMQGTVESLNVSVSVGISLYEACRQRQKTA